MSFQFSLKLSKIQHRAYGDFLQNAQEESNEYSYKMHIVIDKNSSEIFL